MLSKANLEKINSALESSIMDMLVTTRTVKGKKQHILGMNMEDLVTDAVYEVEREVSKAVSAAVTPAMTKMITAKTRAIIEEYVTDDKKFKVLVVNKLKNLV